MLKIIKCDTDKFPIATITKNGRNYEVYVMPKNRWGYEKIFTSLKEGRKWVISELKKHYQFTQLVEWNTEKTSIKKDRSGSPQENKKKSI